MAAERIGEWVSYLRDASAYAWTWVCSWVRSWPLWQKDAKLLFLGLDNAGKTTLLYVLKDNRVTAHVPTHHPNMEEVQLESIRITAWDLGGHQQARHIWETYFVDCHGIVFLVDSADGPRLDEARHELNELLKIEELAHVPVMILGNKIDLPGAYSEHGLRNALGLQNTTGRNTSAQAVTQLRNEGRRPIELFMCSVVKRQGYGDAFRWLAQHL